MALDRHALGLRTERLVCTVVGWNDLPCDVQKKIFGLLELADFGTAAIACKQWHCEYRFKVACAGARLVKSHHVFSELPQVMLEGVLKCWDYMCQHFAQQSNVTLHYWVD